jgi:hypothetical protein
MESVLKRIAKNAGVLAAAASEWPATGVPVVVNDDDGRYANIVASSLSLLSEASEEDPSIQVTIGKIAVLAEQRGDRALVIVSDLGHSIRKSLRRIMRQSFKRLGVAEPTKPSLPPEPLPSMAPQPTGIAPAPVPFTIIDGGDNG